MPFRNFFKSSSLQDYVAIASLIRLGILFFLLCLVGAEYYNFANPEFRFLYKKDSVYIVFFITSFFINIGYLFFIKKIVKYNYFFHIQYIIDIIISSVWIFLTGGIFSNFLFLYIVCTFFYGRNIGFKISAIYSIFSLIVIFFISSFQFYYSYLWGEYHFRGSDIAYSYSLFFLAMTLICVLIFSGEKKDKKYMKMLLDQEKYLKRSDELKFFIFDWINVGIISIENDGKITSINKYALNFSIENKKRKVLNKEICLCFPDFKNLWENRFIRKGESDIQSSTYSGVIFGVKIHEFPDDKGWGIIFSDISKIKKLEKKVQDMEKMATIGELAAGLAHEMKNPLAGIKTSLQLFNGANTDIQLRDRLSKIIVRDIDRLDNLLKNFLGFANPHPAVKSWIDCFEIIESILMPLKIQYKNITIQNRTNGFYLFFDSDHFFQILLNIIINAFHALENQENPFLSIHTEIFEDKIILVIEDNGPGIPQNILLKCFDPFITTKNVGSGLGLSIARRLANQNNASIDAESKEGCGTRFFIIQDSSFLKILPPEEIDRDKESI